MEYSNAGLAKGDKPWKLDQRKKTADKVSVSRQGAQATQNTDSGARTFAVARERGLLPFARIPEPSVTSTWLWKGR
jgi:hypothetical protein